jgi:small subunit ribosomal protein S3
LRADIDYGFTEAHTTYGVIGIKAWVYRGEILEAKQRRGAFNAEPEPRRREPAPRRDRDRERERSRPPQSGAYQPTPTAPTGPAVQAPPGEMPHPAKTGGPIAPPLSPPTPAWKQEVKTEPEPGTES